MIISESDVIWRRTGEASPLLKARIAGVLYLIIIVTAGFAEGFVRDKLVVGSDAAATANNLLTHELLALLISSIWCVTRFWRSSFMSCLSR